MNLVASIVAIVLLLMALPIFLVFGIGGALAAIVGMELPWSTLIQVAFGSVTKHVLVAVPLFAAIALSLNLEITHLYVVFVAFAGIGMITPPVCVGIYTSAGVIRESPEKAFREVPLFVLVGIVYGILMVLFPAASTWLPKLPTQ